MVRTQIQLNDEQAERIKKIAADRHISMAEVVRQAVDMIIASNMAAGAEERKNKALAAVGKFGSGRHDIAREHDKYLAEAFHK